MFFFGSRVVYLSNLRISRMFISCDRTHCRGNSEQELEWWIWGLVGWSTFSGNGWVINIGWKMGGAYNYYIHLHCRSGFTLTFISFLVCEKNFCFMIHVSVSFCLWIGLLNMRILCDWSARIFCHLHKTIPFFQALWIRVPRVLDHVLFHYCIRVSDRGICWYCYK